MMRRKVLVVILGMLPFCSTGQGVPERTCSGDGGARSNCSAAQLANAAAAMHAAGRLDEAEALASRALSSLRSDPPESPARAVPLYVLASVQLERGLIARARESYGEMQRISGAAPGERALIYGIGAALSQIEGRWDEAESGYKQAAADFENAGREHGAESASVLAELATLYVSEHRYPQALAVVDQAFKTLDRATNAVPLDRIELLNLRGAILGRRNRWRDAEKDYAEAFALTHAQSKVDSVKFQRMAENYAVVLRKLHRDREAKVLASWAATLRSDAPISGNVIDVTELMRHRTEKGRDK